MNSSPLDRSGDRLRWVAWIIFATVAAVVFLRIHVGVDFSDEALYVSLPYSFLLGHRPIEDELAVHQFAALLLVPLARAHLALVPTADGIVLFFRYAYYAAAAASAILAARTFSRLAPQSIAVLIGAIVFCYIPFAIPSLSYNTIVLFGLLAGLLVLFGRTEDGRPFPRLFFGTLLLGMATFAYPTILPASASAVLISLPLWRHIRTGFGYFDWAIPVALAAALWLAFSGYVLLSFGGYPALSRLLEFNEAFAAQGGGMEKLTQIVRQLGRLSDYLVRVVVILAAAVLLVRIPKALPIRLIALLGVGPLLWLARPNPMLILDPRTTGAFVISIIGIGALPFVVTAALRRPSGSTIQLLAISSISFVAGIVIAWSTANGVRNMALGLLPAALAGLALLGNDTAGERERSTPRSHWPAAALLVSLLAFLAYDLCTHVYSDTAIAKLDTRVPAGAWAGLRTSPQRVRFIETLENDLEGVRTGAESILFFDYFPAGYLFSDLRPRTPALWMFPANRRHWGNPAIRVIYANEFSDDESLPDVVVQMKIIPKATKMKLERMPQDPVRQRFSAPLYEELVDRPAYTILERARPQPGLDSRE